MSVQFYDLQVQEIINETKDVVTLSFVIPDSLIDVFKYKSGQYLTIKIPDEEQETRRAYSICSSPFIDKDIAVTVKKVENGNVSTYLNDKVKVGDVLSVMPPMGTFTVEPFEDKKYNYILFAGGSGITPLMSILKSVLFVEKESNVLLVYSNRNEESIIYKKNLQQIELDYPERFQILHIFSRPNESWNGLKGRLNEGAVSEILSSVLSNDPVNKPEIFMCGPAGMMSAVESAGERYGIERDHIHKERFTAPPQSTEGSDVKIVPHLEKRRVKMKLYGEMFEFDVEADDNILMASKKDGADAPYSCLIGACSVCRAKLISGSVYMDETDSLTEEEMNSGLVVACQAHPLDDNVFLDFDAV